MTIKDLICRLVDANCSCLIQIVKGFENKMLGDVQS